MGGGGGGGRGLGGGGGGGGGGFPDYPYDDFALEGQSCRPSQTPRHVSLPLSLSLCQSAWLSSRPSPLPPAHPQRPRQRRAPHSPPLPTHSSSNSGQPWGRQPWHQWRRQPQQWLALRR